MYTSIEQILLIFEKKKQSRKNLFGQQIKKDAGHKILLCKSFKVEWFSRWLSKSEELSTEFIYI